MPTTCAAASSQAAATSSWRKRRRRSWRSCCRSCRRHAMPLEAELQQFVDAVAAHPLPDDLRALRAISESTLPQLQGAPQPCAPVREQKFTTPDGLARPIRISPP
ncbi:hypothetical protein G6F56_014473 [Rhizopus delemar]|nr:hypothetical protein G6F56_014473 [Rhizopus delemar]